MNPIVKYKPNMFLRGIFLNLFITGFIIICYFYISEIFGSISTPFVENPQFAVQFGITLLVFTFFSILAGPYHGGITGFIGEFLYQLAYYDVVYVEWCVLIAFWGVACGIYKHKPLRYTERKNLYLSFGILSIISIIMATLIVIIHKFYYNSSKNIFIIFLELGVKFLVQSFLSIIIIVPIFLLVYDRAFSKEEKHLYYMILTHHPVSMRDHTFHLRFGKTYVYFCSRCSGVIIGGSMGYFFTHLIEVIYDISFNPELAVLLCIALPIPGLIDWGTQRMLLRKSTTNTRLFTGFIIGAALHLMSFTYKYYFFMIFLLTLYFSILFLLMYLGHRKEMRTLKKELTKEINSNNLLE